MRAATLLTLFALTATTGDEARPAPGARAWLELLAAPDGEGPLRLAGIADRAPALLLELANRAIPGRITAGATRFVAPRTVILDDVRATDPEGNEVGAVRRVEALVRLSALLDGNVVVERLTVDGPTLPLKMIEGRLNLLRAFLRPPDGEERARPDIDVILESVIVNDAALTFASDGLDIRADGASAAFRVELYVKAGHFVVRGSSARATRASIDLPELGLPITVLKSGPFTFRSSRLTLDAVDAVVAGATVAARGDVVLQGGGRFELTASVKAPRGAWPDRLAPLPFALPAVSAATLVSGTFGAPLVILDASTGDFAPYGYRIASAEGQVVVTRQAIAFDQSTATFVDGGVARARGTLGLASRKLDVDVELDALPLAVALGPTKLDEPIAGRLHGAVAVRGTARAGQPLEVRAAVRARGLRGFGFHFDNPLDVEAKLRTADDTVTLDEVRATGPDVEASGRGTIRLEAKELALAVATRVGAPERFTDRIPDDVRLSHLRFEGAVSGRWATPRVDGDLVVEDGRAYGVALAAVRSPLGYDAGVLTLPRLAGTVAQGALSGNATVRLTGARSVRANVALDDVDLESVTLGDGRALPVAGRARLDARVEGPLDDPTATVAVRGEDLKGYGESLGTVEAELIAGRDLVEVVRGDVIGRAVAVRVGRLSYAPRTRRIDGFAHVERLDLAGLAAAEHAGLTGVIEGPFTLGGTVDRPLAQGRVTARRLGVSGTLLGDGHGLVRLEPERPDDDELKVALVFTVRGPRGVVDARGAYALERRRVNARLEIAEVEVGPFMALVGDGAPRADGALSGVVEVHGPVDAPDATFALSAPAMTFFPPDDVDAPPGEESVHLARTRTRGRATLDGALTGGRLTARLCAFPSDAARELMTPCDEPVRVFADIDGDVDLKTGAYALSIDAAAIEEDVDVFVPALREAGVDVGGRVRADVDLVRRAGGAVDARGILAVEDLRLAARDAPEARLVEPAFVRFTPGIVELERPMAFSVGERAVRVNGRVNLVDKTLTGSVRGSFALALVALFSREITQPTGVLDAQVAVAGPFAEPEISGCVAPLDGVAFTSRGLGRRVELLSGELCLTPLDDDGGPRDRVRASQVAVAVDDGRMTLDGTVDLAWRKRDALDVQAFDLTSSATDVIVGGGRTWGEIDYDLALTGPRAAPALRGRFEVSEGALRESFELTNFVVTKKPGRPSAPLYEQLRVVGLENLGLEVDAVVTAFDARASASSVRADASIRGDLHVGGTLRVPVLTGAIEVTEGRFQFPYATFDVEQSQIEFVRRPDGRPIPRIFLVARTELEPPRNGLDTEVPVVLRLDGDLEQMRLELAAEDTDLDVSQNALFLYVLFGAPLSASERFADNSGALRAVSSELTAAFTRDIETALAQELGTDVQFQLFYDEGRVKGGVRYALGKRVEIEGEAGLFGGDASSEATPTSTGELRLRLLLVDHLPYGLGRQVAFVGQMRSFSTVESTDAATSDLRLTYRVFEY